jgi:pre-rRNA-processing protein TSR3
MRRGIPNCFSTAYPRRSKISIDPEAGLASVEALYLAKRILGEEDPSILQGYHWREEFLGANKPV